MTDDNRDYDEEPLQDYEKTPEQLAEEDREIWFQMIGHLPINWVVIAWHGEILVEYWQNIPPGAEVLGWVGYTPMDDKMKAQPLSIRLARRVLYSAYNPKGNIIGNDYLSYEEACGTIDWRAACG